MVENYGGTGAPRDDEQAHTEANPYGHEPISQEYTAPQDYNAPQDYAQPSYEEQPQQWQDEQMPVDDFSDPTDPALHAEGEHIEGLEEAGVTAEEEISEPAQDQDDIVPVKKKSSLIPMIVGVVGILFIGGMAYMQFFGGEDGGSQSAAVPVAEAIKTDSTSTQAPVRAVNNAPVQAATSTAAAPTQTTTTTTTTNTGAQPDMNAIYAAGNQGAGAANTQTGTRTSDVITTTGGADGAMPAPAAPAPAAVTTNTVTTTAPAPAAAQAPMPAYAPGANPAAMDARLTDLSARVEAMQKALDQTAQQLGQLSNNMNDLLAHPPAVTGGAVAAASPEMNSRLDRIEQQLAQMASAPHVASSAGTVDSAAPMPIASSTSTDAPVAKASKHERRTVASRSSRRHSKHEAASSESKRWILRAATPDSAWVAHSEESDELRQVEVGQKLPGIGTVRAIRQAGGSWEIVGTAGTIR